MKTPSLYTADVSREDRVFLLQEASKRSGLPAYIIEKDYIVSYVLYLLFEKIKPMYQEACDSPFLFKGGTSLSKIYAVIHRMSEDIDLSVNMQMLGLPEPEDESNSARSRRIGKLIERNCEFAHELQDHLASSLQNVHDGFEVFIDPIEQQNLIIRYPRSLPESYYFSTYLKPQVLVETGSRAAFKPYESQLCTPIMHKEIHERLGVPDDCHTVVDVLSMDRTFYEKLTLLHELNHRGKDAVTHRQARHLYDIRQIFLHKPEILNRLDLLEDVAQHKSKYFRRHTARWDLAKPGSLTILPPVEIESLLREDWKKMPDLFPNAALPCSFDQLLEVLSHIDSLLNR